MDTRIFTGRLSVRFLSRLSVLIALLTTSLLFGQLESVLIRTSKPYTNLLNAIRARGGTVTYQYKYVNAIAAEIPQAELGAITAMVAPGALSKDLIVPAPSPVDVAGGHLGLVSTGDENQIVGTSVQALSPAQLAATSVQNPNAYLINDGLNGSAVLHAQGLAGQGIVVAVIDSGIRPGFPHLSLDGSVVGCEDFVSDGLGCSNSANNGHGTFAAGMISANVLFAFPASSSFRNAVLAECPGCFLDPPTNTVVPMLGSAPLASIYALRVFGPTGGAPTSRTIAAMERAIWLRELYDAGSSLGANIQVVNVSLGGSTVYAGHDLFDEEVDYMLSKNIVPVVAAGNAGPSSLTVASPGTAVGAVTVGAASLAHNERILRRLQLGPVVGPLYRPFLGSQTGYFSSRGPNADGRGDPDVTANGFACFGQGYGTPSTVSFGTGTSFSTPTVAGIAALLRQAFPSVTASQIRNAIVATGNPALLSDGSTTLDRGSGYVNAADAYSLLGSGQVPTAVVSGLKTSKSVEVNVEKGSLLNVSEGLVIQPFSNLKPGERGEVLYRVGPNTKQVVVGLSDVAPALPPSGQNQLFGDDILFAVHSAKTSAIGDGGDYPHFTFTSGGTFVVNNPETGVMRITVNGDWTNAGTISAKVTVFSTTDPIPQFTSQGKVANGQTIAIPVNVPAGTSVAEFQLGFREDWGDYPTSDVDLFLIAPNGAVYGGGVTLNSPERVVFKNPAAGTWVALIYGFQVWTDDDKYEFRAALDGKTVP